MFISRWIATLSLALFSPGVIQATGLKPAAPRCEYRVNPRGIDAAQPRLTWRVESDAREARQIAYRILVASSAEQLVENSGDLWDSGKITSGETVNITYGGRPLVSRAQCFWKVCVWDQAGKAKWSEPAE